MQFHGNMYSFLNAILICAVLMPTTHIHTYIQNWILVMEVFSTSTYSGESSSTLYFTDNSTHNPSNIISVSNVSFLPSIIARTCLSLAMLCHNLNLSLLS